MRKVRMRLPSGACHQKTSAGSYFEFRGREYHRRDVGDLLEDLEDELERDRKWMHAVDREVFVTFYQMASQLGKPVVKEFMQRYDFHLKAQKLIEEMVETQEDLGEVLGALTEADASMPPRSRNPSLRGSVRPRCSTPAGDASTAARRSPAISRGGTGSWSQTSAQPLAVPSLSKPTP